MIGTIIVAIGGRVGKEYAPYAKWFGTAFGRLACARDLSPHLDRDLAARTWREREDALVRAYEIIATMHNELGITDPLPTKPQSFFGRPFQVIALRGFADAIVAAIEDEAVRRLTRRPWVRVSPESLRAVLSNAGRGV